MDTTLWEAIGNPHPAFNNAIKSGTVLPVDAMNKFLSTHLVKMISVAFKSLF